jgi:hypothetical protein
LVQEEFDGVAWISQDGAYQSLDYQAAILELSDDRTREIPLETVDAYGDPLSPLGADWLLDFREAQISRIEPFTLVVSRRPIELDAPALEETDDRVRVVSENAASGRHLSSIYLVDVSGGLDEERYRALLRTVREDIERREVARRSR